MAATSILILQFTANKSVNKHCIWSLTFLFPPRSLRRW